MVVKKGAVIDLAFIGEKSPQRIPFGAKRKRFGEGETSAGASSSESALCETYLVERARRGDVEAFGALVQTHEKKIYNMAYRMLGNPDDAFDAAQEAFTKAFFSLESFKGTSSFSTWLYRIAVNICLDELRRRKRNKVLPLDAPLSLSEGEIPRELPSASDTPEQILSRKELLRDIQKSILSLSPEHRLAITLRDMQGLSYEEIANLTGASLGTVKSRIHRARHALKNTILSGELLPSATVSRARKSPDTNSPKNEGEVSGLKTDETAGVPASFDTGGAGASTEIKKTHERPNDKKVDGSERGDGS